MQRAGRATQLLPISGLDLFKDPADNAIVAHCGCASEIFHPGKSSKGIKVFRQFRPFRQLKNHNSYRDNSEGENKTRAEIGASLQLLDDSNLCDWTF